MTGRERISATELAREVGVAQPTLSRWVREASVESPVEEKRGKRVLAKTLSSKTRRPMRPQDLSAIEKLRLVHEASELTDQELGDFLRRNGLKEAHLRQWSESALAALEGPGKRSKSQSPEVRENRELKREIRRKDAALAEMSAILTLKKKLASLLGDEGDDTTRRSGR